MLICGWKLSNSLKYRGWPTGRFRPKADCQGVVFLLFALSKDRLIWQSNQTWVLLNSNSNKLIDIILAM